MSEIKLPKEVADIMLQVLTLLKKNPGMSLLDMHQLMDYYKNAPYGQKDYVKFLANGDKSGNVYYEMNKDPEARGGQVRRFYLGERGAAILDNIKHIHVYKMSERRKGKAPVKRQKPPHKEPPREEQRDLNLSSNAENAMATFTTLIDENSRYRELMQKVSSLMLSELDETGKLKPKGEKK